MPERLGAPLLWKKPRYVFVNSMSDVFHPQVPFEFVYEMFSVMREAARERGHVFQVLTKRPGRAVAWWKRYEQQFPEGWPPNVWIGTSVESQKYAPRLTVLSRLPAPIRFVSAEPLLEPVNLRPWLDSGDLQWVIVGGESGHNARPMSMELGASDLRDQSTTTLGVAILPKTAGRRKRQAWLEKRPANGRWASLEMTLPIPWMLPTRLSDASESKRQH